MGRQCLGRYQPPNMTVRDNPDGWVFCVSCLVQWGDDVRQMYGGCGMVCAFCFFDVCTCIYCRTGKSEWYGCMAVLTSCRCSSVDQILAMQLIPCFPPLRADCLLPWLGLLVTYASYAKQVCFAGSAQAAPTSGPREIRLGRRKRLIFLSQQLLSSC